MKKEITAEVKEGTDTVILSTNYVKKRSKITLTKEKDEVQIGIQDADSDSVRGYFFQLHKGDFDAVVYGDFWKLE